MTESIITDNFELHSDLKLMRRALQRCKGFGLYFARCNNNSLRTELVTTLKDSLAAPIIELTLNPDNAVYIDVQMAEVLENAPDNAIVFIYDIEKLFNLENRHLIAELNWRRGFYGRINHPVVFWLPEFLLVELFQNAPDFMDWRSGVYEFSLPKSERINLITNTWQTISDNFFAQLPLSEKKRWTNNLNHLLARISEQESTKTKSDLLNRLGQLYYSLGHEHHRDALFHFLKSLGIQKKLPDKRGEAATRNNIAQIYKLQGDGNIASEYLDKSLRIMHETGNKKGEGETYHIMASNEIIKGNYVIALDYLDRSLRIRQEMGDKIGECETRNSIAIIHDAENNYKEALHHLDESLKIWQHNKSDNFYYNNPEVENDNDVSSRYIAGAVKGDDKDVLKYLNQSLKVMKKISDKKIEGITLNNIARIYDKQGEYDTALPYLTKSLEIQQAIGDKQGEGATLNNISQIYDAKGDYDTALPYLIKSLEIQQAIGDKQGEGATLNNISQIYDAKGDYNTALRYLKQSLEIMQVIGNEFGECSTLFNIGHIHSQNNEQQLAMPILLKTYSIAKKIHYVQALKALEKLAKQLGKDGLAYWEALSSSEKIPS